MIVTEEKSLDWTTARQNCQNLGGDLASPLSNAEIDQLAQFNLTGKNAYAWLGGELVDHQNPKKGWKWITGEPLPANFAKWYSAEDRDDGGDCLCFNLQRNKYHGKFFSCSCGDDNNGMGSYVCQLT